MMKIAIFDLDGCLSDDRWRRGALPREDELDKPEAWDKYHKHCGADAPINVGVLYNHRDNGDEIVFVTARPAKYRERTNHWIQTMLDLPSSTYALLMRPNHDRSTSAELKAQLVEEWIHIEREDWKRVVAYDDRDDVLAAYRLRGAEVHRLTAEDAEDAPQPLKSRSTADVLRAMADTFEERNAVYGDNYRRVAPVIEALWPGGVPGSLVTEPHWHLFELIVVKLTRFVISDLTHTDSIHDAAIYAAMIETHLKEKQRWKKELH